MSFPRCVQYVGAFVARLYQFLSSTIYTTNRRSHLKPGLGGHHRYPLATYSVSESRRKVSVRPFTARTAIYALMAKALTEPSHASVTQSLQCSNEKAHALDPFLRLAGLGDKAYKVIRVRDEYTYSTVYNYM